MEERDLVKREDAAEDGRGSVVVLTRQGLKAIAEAAPVHFADVRKHMMDVLTERQIESLADLAGTVVAHLESE
jgi:DNA-binding MarR family transcriptional regulator